MTSYIVKFQFPPVVKVYFVSVSILICVVDISALLDILWLAVTEVKGRR